MTTQNKTRVADVANAHELKMKLIGLKNQLTAVNDTGLSHHFRCYREYPYTYVSVPSDCTDLHSIPELNSCFQES